MLDLAGRRIQAQKILGVVERFARTHGSAGQDMTAWRCLDVGCSIGAITRSLAERHAVAIGVDVDRAALRHPLAQQTWQSADWRAWPVAASALALPCAEAAFDLAVCNQVYQYVPDVARLLAEIQRVLRPGGVCFFSGRNLWGIAARQNRLPWLMAVVPRVGRLVEGRYGGRGSWRHTAGALWPYWKLRDLAARYFTVFDYTTAVLTDPALAPLFLPSERQRTLARRLGPFLPALKPILPTHLWILVKG